MSSVTDLPTEPKDLPVNLSELLLEAFPGIAMLIDTKTSKILGFNKKAAENGASLGDCCYSKLWNNESKCHWCRLKDVTNTNQETKTIFEENGKIWEYHWKLIRERIVLVYSIDVTKREQTNKETEVIKKRLENILYGTGVGTWEWNIPTGEVIFNERWAEMIGYTLGELQPVSIQTWINYVNADDLEKSNNEITRHINGETDQYECESRMKHKNGDWIWVLDRGKIISRTEDGKPLLMYGTHLDITERKKSELQLKENEKRYHQLYNIMRLMSDTMSDMIWVKDLDKKYIFANKAICDKLLTAEDTTEPIGKNDLFFAKRERLAHPENPEWHTFGELCRDSDDITLQEMKEMQFDEFGNVKGKFLYLDVRKAPLFDNEGNLIGIVGSARDITEKKLAEEELKKSLEKNKALLTANPDLMFVFDKDLTIIDYNAALGKGDLYVPPEVFLGKKPEEVLPEDVANAMNLSIREVFETGKPIELIYSLEMQDTIKHFNARYVKAGTEEVVNIVQNITEKYNTEKALKESEERFEALHNASFGGIVIHDLGKIVDCNKGLSDITGYSHEELIGMDGLLLISEDFRDDVREKIRSGYGEAYESFGIRKNGEKYPLRLQGKNIPYQGKTVRVTEFRDITVQKKSEMELNYSAGFQKLLMEISSTYINLPLNKVDETINHSLAEIGKFVGADRTYIFNYYPDSKLTTNTYEWCAEGIEPQIQNLQNVPLAEEWIDAFNSGNSVYIENIQQMPPGLAREILEPQGIKSLIVFPLIIDNSFFGFVGFDSVTDYHQYSENEQKLLKVFSDLLVNIQLRQKQEKLLTERETLLRTIIENAPFEIWARDLDQICILENYALIDHWGSLLGTSPDKSKLTEEEYQTWVENNQRAMNGKVVNQEVVYNVNGEKRYFQNILAPIKDGEKITGFTGFNIDITNSKKAEEKLIQNAEQLNTITSTSLDGYWMINLNGKLLDVNEAYCKLTGYTRDELLNMTISDLEVIENPELTKLHIKKLIATGFDKFETKHRCKNGEILEFEVSATYSNKINSIFVFLSDISERKRNENELHNQLNEINSFNKLMIGREERMIELKNEINNLRKLLGEQEKYNKKQVDL